MSQAMLLALPLAFGMGISLGLLGGGGSILTVPILVYIFRLPPMEAIATSLVVVGTTAVFGAGRHARHDNVDFRVALGFGVTGIVGAWAASRVVSEGVIPEPVLMGAFAVLMVVVSSLMLRGSGRPEPDVQEPRSTVKVALYGLLTGLLTGTLGVGGGFVIVPMLLLVGKLRIHRAIGTSLVVIFLNCVAGLLGYLGRVPVSWDLAGIFAVVGIAGSMVGASMAARWSPTRLKRGFAVFVLVLGIAVLADQLVHLR